MDPVNSTTFIKRPPPPAKGEEALFVARDILLNRLFLGNYVERRYVGQIKDYRDVIAISTAETELVADLDKIRQNIYRDFGAKWVGITGPEFDDASTGHCLWVKLTNIPFGRFWFQIKQIKCEGEEIIVRLKCIRSARIGDYGDISKQENELLDCKKKNCNEKSSELVFEFDPADKLATLYMHLNEAVTKVRPHLTWQNLVLVSKFLIAVAVILVTALITCIQYLGEYLLRLMRELSFFLKAISPVLIQGIECITKVIGGLFILIALLFRKHSPAIAEQFQSRPKLPSLMQGPPTSATVVPKPALTNSPVVAPSDWRERNRALRMELLS